MRSGSKKLLCGFLAALMLVLSCAAPVSAAVQGRDSIQNCADGLRESYREWNDAAFAGVDPESLARNYQATLDYNKIIDYVNNYEGVLRQYFAGAWINDEDTLVVAFSGKFDTCRELVLKRLVAENVIFTEGVGSYYKGVKMLEAVDEAINALYESYNERRMTSAEAEKLLELLPCAKYNYDTNTVAIVFKTDEAAELAVEKSKKAAALTEKEREAVAQFNKAVETFKAEVLDEEGVEYRASSEDCTVEFRKSEWRAGRKIFIRNLGNALIGEASTGYRAKMKVNGTTYDGFVTCGHGMYKGFSIYVNSYFGASYKLGTILDYRLGGNLDVSFFKLTNSSYITSNNVYYTSSSGSTSGNIVLDGTYATPAVGTRVNKAGGTTWLTTGVIKDLFAEVNVYDKVLQRYVHMTGMIKAEMKSNEGDSGGILYVLNGSTWKGKAVGIVSCGNNTYTFFIKAATIKGAFGAWTY